MKFTPDGLQQAMFEQMKTGEVFDHAVASGKAHLKGVCDRNVAPTAESQDALKRFVKPLPDRIGEAVDVLAMLDQAGTPATMAQSGGRFFGLVNGSVIPVSLAARMLGDAWDQNAVLHAVSPVNATLEDVCQSWLVELLGLPPQTVAGFVSGSSMAIVCGLAAARYRLCANHGWDINAKGLEGAPRLRIADEMPPLDDRTILILQAGNVNSGSFDPLRQCGEIANEAGAWVHIDGAFGLWAAACSDLCHLTDGLELAQSWSVDGQKTLNTPYDSGISLCADGEALVKSLQNSGAYIMYSENRDGMVYTPEMSRRARAVDLWGALKYLGREGVDALVLGLHQRAKQFAEELVEAGFDVLNEAVFSQVIVNIGDEAKTASVIEHIQRSGECWVGGSQWFGEPVIRISVCSWAATRDDVSRSVRAFVAAREAVL